MENAWLWSPLDTTMSRSLYNGVQEWDRTTKTQMAVPMWDALSLDWPTKTHQVYDFRVDVESQVLAQKDAEREWEQIIESKQNHARWNRSIQDFLKQQIQAKRDLLKQSSNDDSGSHQWSYIENNIWASPGQAHTSLWAKQNKTTPAWVFIPTKFLSSTVRNNKMVKTSPNAYVNYWKNKWSS